MKQAYTLLLLLIIFPALAWALDPIQANPDTILAYSQNRWRNSRYEVFQWQDMAAIFSAPILIFDTATYDVQNRLTKRLAFFVEKPDFNGHLLTDAELAPLNGWRAHDYKADDLAAFFHTAARTRFTLSREELELRELLLDTGIIRQAPAGGFIAGAGAIVSLSQESSRSLRYTHIVHECFHAIFFLDEDFRAFSRRRFEKLDPQAKRFILAYFDYLGYDTSNDYLMVNEFMGYILQQPLSETVSSFTNRAITMRAGTKFGPLVELTRVFQVEAEAFSAYVNQRWGLAAGKIQR
ncbi:MAG: hypothetical protein LBD79_04100 [Treponema sp.]|jgi:hypothetical protein|nr:hypothetical protein [Treponema sp.]